MTVPSEGSWSDDRDVILSCPPQSPCAFLGGEEDADDFDLTKLVSEVDFIRTGFRAGTMANC